MIGVSLALSCAVAGCGKSVGGAAPPVARADLALQAAQVFCDSFADCCQAQAVPVDAQTCSTNLAAYFEEGWKGLEAGTTYDADAAGECVAALRSTVQCGDADSEALDSTCGRVFVGHVKPGQPCTESIECEKPASGSVFCDTSEQAASNPEQGRCKVEQATERVHAKLGEACVSSCDGTDCDTVPAGSNVGGPVSDPAPTGFCYREDGIYCAAGGRCAPWIAQGEICDNSEQCAGSAFGASETHTCTALRANGSRCKSDRDCHSGNCRDAVCADVTVSVDACRRGAPPL